MHEMDHPLTWSRSSEKFDQWNFHHLSIRLFELFVLRLKKHKPPTQSSLCFLTIWQNRIIDHDFSKKNLPVRPFLIPPCIFVLQFVSILLSTDQWHNSTTESLSYAYKMSSP